MRLSKVTMCGAALVLVALLGGAASAFACTNLALVNMSLPGAPPGATIDLTAAGFSGAVAGDPFTLHWGATNGPALATAPVDQAGNLSARFTVPDAAPGYYVITIDPMGLKTRFQVLSPSQANPAAAPAPPLASVTPEPSSNGVALLAATIGTFGLGLFGAGFVAVTRENRRRRRVPVAVPAQSGPH